MLSWNIAFGVVAFCLIPLIAAQNAELNGHVSIIDILSDSAQFSVLIRLLQRTGLVPVLNEATNVTFIAPTNAAFVDVDPSSVTKEVLLYHILNRTVLLEDTKSDVIAPTYLRSADLDFSTSETSDSYALPIYLEYKSKAESKVGNVSIVNKDLKASRGHGVVQVVDELLAIPKSVCHQLSHNNDTKIFARLFEKEFNCSLSILPSYSTLLVPLDSAFNELNEVELTYIFSPSAKKDRRRLLSRHVLDSFVASPLIDKTVNVTALDGTNLTISSSMTVNELFTPIEKDIIASDGVIHYYDKFISGIEGKVHSLIDFTPEKYCLALEADGFVKELKFRGLLDLVQGKTEPQTLFVPLDDQEDQFSIQSSNSLLYHFVQGQHELDFDSVYNTNTLLESKSSHKKLGGGYQRIRVGADLASHSIYLNTREKKIVKGPYLVGNTTLYAVEGSLDLPTSMDVAVGAVYHSSKSALYLSDLELLDLPSNNDGWTILLPTNNAWEELDLVHKYLVSNETALRGVFESLIIAEAFYSDSQPSDTVLLDGEPVHISMKHEKPKKISSAREDLQLLINDTSFSVQTANVLSSSGVAHSVSQVEIPDNINISPEDILNAVDTSRFVELLAARNFSHVLDPKSSYTILAPSNQALKASNITVDTPEIDVLLRLHILPGNPIDTFLDDGKSVESLENGIHLTAKELNSGLYLVSIVEGDMREIRVLNRGDSSIKGDSSTTILYVDRFLSPDWITRISPPPKHHFRLNTPAAILLGMVCGAILIFSVLSCALFFFLKRNNKNKPSSGSNTPHGSGSRSGSPDSERRPLIGRKSSNFSTRGGGGNDGDFVGEGDEDMVNGYGSASRSRRSSMRSARSGASENSVSEPIATVRVQKDREHGKHLAIPRV